MTTPGKTALVVPPFTLSAMLTVIVILAALSALISWDASENTSEHR